MSPLIGRRVFNVALFSIARGEELKVPRLQASVRFVTDAFRIGITNSCEKGNQALPFILAHHQRTPTNRNRQSWKNSGGLPSKA
jgi:hypothetical protein